MADGEELLVLIDRDIPEGRKSLQENYKNLEHVAKYCENNYLQAKPHDKAQALQQTKNYTTHSLASVAYQINSLATNFLKLLDLQQNQLTDMESSVNHLNQIVMIHKEKVARREIGVLTSGRNVPRPLGMKNGIIYPEQNERPIKYTRKSIDYSVLDDIGHGVRQQQASSTPRAARSPSISSTHSNTSNSTNNPNQAPTTKPPTPPVIRASGGTIGRSGGGHYRSVAPPVAPPVAPAGVPQQQMPPPQGNNNYSMHLRHHPSSHNHHHHHHQQQQQQHPSSRSSVSSGGSSSYSPSNTLVMGHKHPHSQPGMGQSIGLAGGYNHHNSVPHPSQASLMHPESKASYTRNSTNRAGNWMETSVTSLPPPPDDDFPEQFFVSPASPPLPPPPSMDMSDQQFDYTPPPPQDFSDARMGPPSTREGHLLGSIPDDTYGTLQGGGEDQYAATGPQLLTQPAWVPKHYLEKVVAIYDYQANKSDELSFSENAVIYVIHKNEDGWWEGVMDGQEGLFPFNYVEGCI